MGFLNLFNLLQKGGGIMKRFLVALSITFLFALILFCPKAKAFPTQAYVCLYIPAFSIPLVFPNAVISLGEYVGILEDLSTSYMPGLMIGAGGFFYVSAHNANLINLTHHLTNFTCFMQFLR